MMESKLLKPFSFACGETQNKEEEGGGTFILGLPTFRISVLSKNFRTGFKISVEIPEQLSQKPMSFQNRLHLS